MAGNLAEAEGTCSHRRDAESGEKTDGIAILAAVNFGSHLCGLSLNDIPFECTHQGSMEECRAYKWYQGKGMVR